MPENLEQTSATLEHIEQLADQLSLQQQNELVRHLLANLRHADQKEASHTASLFGRWRGKFPEDIDLDKELTEIRHEWLKELDESENEAQPKEQ